MSACKLLRIKHFHGVSSGNQHPYLLKSRYGKVSIELLNANEQLRRDTTEKLLVINESTGEHVELPLVVR